MDTDDGAPAAMSIVRNSSLLLEPSALSLKEIVRPVLSQLNQVEEQLKAVGQESEGILKEASRYVLCGGGKRLRASLVLFCSSIPLTPPFLNEKKAIEIAAAVELIHSATLVHDDIVDRAVLRRLKPTVNLQFGEEVAVLLGDFLYARAFEMIARVGDANITSWMAETTQTMCAGELDQLRHRYRAELSLQEYLSFIERKTAALISACARCGAKLAQLSCEQQQALASFGLNIGVAYQMVDDLLDVIGSENRLGKTLRTDAGSGKMTLPLILLLKHFAGAERLKFLEDLRSANPNWKTIQSQIQKHQIVRQTEEFAEDYFRRAVQSIKDFSAPIGKSLEDLSRFILNRDY